MRGRVLAALLGEAVEVGEAEPVRKRRQPLELVRLLSDDSAGLRVLEDVSDLTRRARRVDGNDGGADREQGEVEQRPVDAARTQDRDPVALANAACE
jgi:hypothetical protein